MPVFDGDRLISIEAADKVSDLRGRTMRFAALRLDIIPWNKGE